MDRNQALIRDIARLFVKYDLKDWRVVIDALRKGGPEYNAIGEAIGALATKPRASGKPKKQPGAERFLTELRETDPRKAEVLKGLYDRLTNKDVAPKLADLRELCLHLGVKDSLPKRREDAVLFVLRHFATLNDDALVSALEQIPPKDRNLQDEYNKWFKIIYTDSR